MMVVGVEEASVVVVYPPAPVLVHTDDGVEHVIAVNTEVIDVTYSVENTIHSEPIYEVTLEPIIFNISAEKLW